MEFQKNTVSKQDIGQTQEQEKEVSLSPEKKQEIIKAVVNGKINLKNCNELIKDDRDINFSCVKCGCGLIDISPSFKNDREIVLEAVKHSGGWNLERASKKLKNDREIVMEAVKNECYSLKFASPELQNDKEIVLEAIKSYSFVLKYASPQLKNDREFILEAMKINGEVLQYISPELRNDKEFIAECFFINPPKRMKDVFGYNKEEFIANFKKNLEEGRIYY